MSTGAVWAPTGSVRGKEDPYTVSSILSWLSEFGHSEFFLQPGGKLASEVVLRRVQLKIATMENSPFEIIQRQSQQYGHQSKEDAEWWTQIIRNQIKAYEKIRRMSYQNHFLLVGEAVASRRPRTLCRRHK